MKENKETKRDTKFLPVIIGLALGVLMLVIGGRGSFNMSADSMVASGDGV